jgi:hypothetical protein
MTAGGVRAWRTSAWQASHIVGLRWWHHAGGRALTKRSGTAGGEGTHSFGMLNF